jgi:CubicO group peptidase (beta-lactamase class C family)
MESPVEPGAERFDVGGIDSRAAPDAKTRRRIAIAGDVIGGVFGFQQRSDLLDECQLGGVVQTLDRVISTATGEDTFQYAAERLFAPVGMTHSTMTTDPAGGTNTFFGLQTTCEDLARFGYLFLRHGRWLDDQVVPKAWVRAALPQPMKACHHPQRRVAGSAGSYQDLSVLWIEASPVATNMAAAAQASSSSWVKSSP